MVCVGAAQEQQLAVRREIESDHVGESGVERGEKRKKETAMKCEISV